jgi:glycosyltransferase involved in cell wall biosynthesis
MSEPSVMILVKNEEFWLPYVLKQTEGYFDSYVVYDVGSTDDTRRVIEWWMDSHSDKTIYRPLPHVPPEVQGTFRNSMIAEGRRDVYFILDGDELYRPSSLQKISTAAGELKNLHEKVDPTKKYGVFTRIEVHPDLRMRYDETRTHHRLYTRDAFWKGTHPGEVAWYKQKPASEVSFKHITCWHMHNTLRSTKEADATKRVVRKGQRTYHPGNTHVSMELLAELPILQKPIEDFPVNPALKALQDEWTDAN